MLICRMGRKPARLNLIILLAKYLKNRYDVPIIVGGAVFDLNYEETISTAEIGLKEKIIDYAVIGAGEIALEKLIKCLDDKKSPSNILACYSR